MTKDWKQTDTIATSSEKMHLLRFENVILLENMKEIEDNAKDLELRLNASERIKNANISANGRLKDENDQLAETNAEYLEAIQAKEIEINDMKLFDKSKMQIDVLSSFTNLFDSEKEARRKLAKNNKIYEKKNKKLQRQVRALQAGLLNLKDANGEKLISTVAKVDALEARMQYEEAQNELRASNAENVRLKKKLFEANHWEDEKEGMIKELNALKQTNREKVCEIEQLQGDYARFLMKVQHIEFPLCSAEEKKEVEQIAKLEEEKAECMDSQEKQATIGYTSSDYASVPEVEASGLSLIMALDL